MENKSTSTKTEVNKRPNLNEILLSWKSPSHPFKKRNKAFYQTIAAMTFLLLVIVFFLHEFLLMGVILAVAFVIYVIYSIPPIEVGHKITPGGIENAGRFFSWNQLSSFWFEKKLNSEVLIIQTHLSYPAQIRIVLNQVKSENVKEIMGKYLIYLEKPPRNFVDNFSNWLGNKIPLDQTVS